MDVEPVWIEGYHEILALHRVLFHREFEDPDSPYEGSPFLAAIQDRLADALEAADPGTGWRDADRRPHRVELVRRRLTEAADWWQKASEQDRVQHVRTLLAPLRPSIRLVVELAGTSRGVQPSVQPTGPASADEGRHPEAL